MFYEGILLICVFIRLIVKKIDKSIEQAESGKTTNIPKDKQKEFFNL